MDKVSSKPIPFLWFFIKRRKLNFFLVFLFISIFSLGFCFLLSPIILKYFIDNINNLSIKQGILLIVLYAFSNSSLIFFAIATKFEFNSVVKASEDIRKFLFKYLLQYSNSYFYNNYSGDITSKINYLVNNLLYVSSTFFRFIRAIFLFIATSFLLLKVNYIIGISTIILYCIYEIIVYKISKKIGEKSKLVVQQENKINGILIDCLSNILNIKSYSRESLEKKLIDKESSDIIKLGKEGNKYKNYSSLFNFFFMFILDFLILALTGKFLIEEKITLGTFAFVFEILLKSADLLTSFSYITIDLINYFVIYKDNLSIIENPIEIENKENASKMKVNEGKIEIKNMTFEY